MNSNGWISLCIDSCKKIKHLSENIVWLDKPYKSGSLIAISSLEDSMGVSIPNLYFKGEYSIKKFCEVSSFGLMYTDGSTKYRVFMLEIYPDHVRSHYDKKKKEEIFGPHIHLGDEKLQQITKKVYSKLNNSDLNRWIYRFNRHARILSNGNKYIKPPFDNDLFGLS